MTGGVSTVVYRATRGDECFYLRILPEDGATFAPEVKAHQLARSLGCAVPEVLHYEPVDPVLGRSIMLTSEIPGGPLTRTIDDADARDSVRAAGCDLARINSIPVEGFGWIERKRRHVPDNLTADYSTLAEMLDREYLPIVGGMPDDALPGIAHSDLGAVLVEALATVDGEYGSWLAHGDFDTSHIYVDGGEYSGIIDFGEIRGMPVWYDLGHHLLHDRERLPYSTFEWLLEGYAQIAPEAAEASDQIRCWSILIAARALYRGLQRAPRSLIVARTRGYLTQAISR